MLWFLKAYKCVLLNLIWKKNFDDGLNLELGSGSGRARQIPCLDYQFDVPGHHQGAIYLSKACRATSLQAEM